MKICSTCGARVEDSERYCPSCGGGELVPINSKPQGAPQQRPTPQQRPAPQQRSTTQQRPQQQAPQRPAPQQRPTQQRPQQQAPQQRPTQQAPQRPAPQQRPAQQAPQRPVQQQRPVPQQRPGQAPQRPAPQQRPVQQQRPTQQRPTSFEDDTSDFEDGFTGIEEKPVKPKLFGKGKKDKQPKPPKEPKRPKARQTQMSSDNEINQGYDPSIGYTKTEQDLTIKDLLIFTLLCLIPFFGIYKVIVTAIGSPTIKPSLTTVARWNLIVGVAFTVISILSWGSLLGILANMM